MVGVTEGFQQIRNLAILRGNYFGQDDLRSRRKICLITPDLASLLFPYQNPVGEDIRVGEFALYGDRRFQGTRRNPSGRTEIQPRTAIVPFPWIKDYTGIRILQDILTRRRSVPTRYRAVALQVRDVLQKQTPPRGAIPGVGFSPEYWKRRGTSSTALSVVLILIALIALLISGIGIMNTGKCWSLGYAEDA